MTDPQKTPWSIIRAALIVASDVRRKHDLGYIEYEAMSALLDEIARQADDQIAALAAVQLAEKDAEIARLRDDAERLDWLEANLPQRAIGTPDEAPKATNRNWWIFADDDARDAEGPTLREAIDSAREAK